MPDGPATHTPHVDDSMAAEVESLTRGAPVGSRAQEHRMAEPPDDDLEIEAIIDFAADARPGTLGETERRRRSELAAALGPHAFPGERNHLLHVAEGQSAAEWILDALARLPVDTRFDTPQDVWETLGGHHELRAVRPVEPATEAHAIERPPPPPEWPARPSVGSERSTVPRSGIWHDVGLLGLACVRLPFAVAARVSRAVLERLPTG